MEKVVRSKNVRREISVVAGPREWNDTRGSWLARVPRKVPTVSFRIVKALFYGEIDDPDHWAARDIRRAAELIEGRKEATALALQYQKIAGGLLAKDPDFYSEDAAALIHAARILSGLGST